MAQGSTHEGSLSGGGTPDATARGSAVASGARTHVAAGGGITSFALKIVAIIGMTANHSAYIFQNHLSLGAQCVLFAVGGLTFPIMAFLLVEGYRHTSNVRRYALRLGVFALVAQVPWLLFLSANGNVLFTLLIGLGVLSSYDHLENRAAFWTLAALGTVVSLLCDWGGLGIVVILLFHVLDAKGAAKYLPAFLSTPNGAVAVPIFLIILTEGLPLLASLVSDVFSTGEWTWLPFVLYAFAGCPLAIPLLARYNGRRGRPLKWFFYAYYPAHIALLGLLYLALFGILPVVT